MPIRPCYNDIRVDGGRLLDRLRKLQDIGRDDEGGVTRLGFAPELIAANSYVGTEAESFGWTATVDAGGNLIVHHPQRQQRQPTLYLGSHLDTVVNGGWLDGAYGVIAALEVLQTLVECGVDLEFAVSAVAFANEEGGLFPQPFWGSMVAAGMVDRLPADPVDYQGNLLSDALAAVGGDMTALDRAAWDPDTVVGYLELHIEQGPVLVSQGRGIGVVDAIIGKTLLEIEIQGAAAHAGTTPMPMRADALVAAARLTTFVGELATVRELCGVATVGRLDVFPNSANTVPGVVRLTVDVRDADPDLLVAAEQAVRVELDLIARQHEVVVGCVRTVATSPVQTDPTIRQRIRLSSNRLGIPEIGIVSGAGHDAQIVSAIAPMGMIFVPSIGGISHVPQENTDPGDLVAGADVLLQTVLELQEVYSASR